MIYEDGSFVEVDWSCCAYRVVVDGKCIAKNLLTFMECQEGKFIANSLDKTVLHFSVPEKYASCKCTTHAIHKDGAVREVTS